MSDFPSFPPNPDFGTGAYRRAIRVTNRPGEVFGELEDIIHAIRCTITHDGEVITDVDAAFVRWPMTTCPGAVQPIRELIGVRLDTPIAWFFTGGRARQNCTHIYDMVIAMLLHARRDEAVRRYDVVIPDNVGDEPSRATLLRDGRPILEWRVSGGGEILSPETYAGRRVIRGFSSWATEALDDEQLDAALILQKGYWQSGGRKVLIGSVGGPIRDQEAEFKGACYSYSSPRFERAERLPSWRDLSDGTRLLRFDPFGPER
ncbi:DUF2889 domain-containing protein [Sphingobium mellinum]|uniref:DUF2889 domain-containing protein n=1 Tax=Sphingobium mellinum TaxID=1387166 RepID=UPI0030EC6C48